MSISLQNNLLQSNKTDDSTRLLKITALWAFSESAFGGILHALTIPLRGLFISSAAVLFISLIALFSKNSKDILKSTLIVILIKAGVSPYSPLAAYLAVTLQGVLGYLLFSTKKFYKISSLLLGLLVLFFSGMQKIVILTILFGNTLWESLDIFIKQVSIEIFNIHHPEINYGYVIIGTYVMLHLVAGLFIGIYAGKLPQKISYYKNHFLSFIDTENGEDIPKKEKRKKKGWFLRPTGVFVIALSIGVIILSYLSPELKDSVALSVVIMLVRSLVITFVWLVIVAPIVKKIFQKFLVKRKSKYSKDFEEIISMFPEFKEIVNYCWKHSSNRKGVKRIRYFLSTSFYYLLLSK
ncbi:MAG: hypothetical protein KJN64_11405 [Ignavibacteria bacterium]|nr:hypothetical protein [Ignavibacteria bacterium]MBT8383558.1 hypothetical protein [Ignavibacteria bacterium]MBT8391244.1 hypothetical protein [Ignavibacteria bacterium]NNJ51603.1 hypothetical protein [Ignavibacteriaceae bacterium]NNL21306.1 hypothetical protein [Ignavibacteriaceae bacterium]